jgi:hypothetical protein
MKKTKQLALVLAIFFSICAFNTTYAQADPPQYNPEMFQNMTKNLDQQLVTIVVNRFNDFSNDKIHNLVQIADSKANVTMAAQSKAVYEQLETWKTSNLTQQEMSSMTPPTLTNRKNN